MEQLLIIGIIFLIAFVYGEMIWELIKRWKK